MPQSRIYYLDNLKAFCILAVIASHVNSFVFGNGACFMNKAIDTFFMGTFFLIIGCTGYTATWIEGIKEMPFLFQLMLNGVVTAAIATVTLQIAQVANHNAAVKKYVLGKF